MRHGTGSSSSDLSYLQSNGECGRRGDILKLSSWTFALATGQDVGWSKYRKRSRATSTSIGELGCIFVFSRAWLHTNLNSLLLHALCLLSIIMPFPSVLLASTRNRHRLNCDRSHEFYSGSVVSQEMLESGGYEGTLSEHLFWGWRAMRGRIDCYSVSQATAGELRNGLNSMLLIVTSIAFYFFIDDVFKWYF